MRIAPMGALLAFAALALLPAPARAVTAPSIERAGAVAQRGFGAAPARDDARQQALTLGPLWQRFQQRHGPWTAMWNEATGTPHRAFGAGIPLIGGTPDAAAVDRAVRQFIARDPALFGTPELRRVAVLQARGTWYVRYEQLLAGLPIRFTDWEFRVSAGGRLFAFGADAHRPTEPPPTLPAVDENAARRSARDGIAFDPATDRVAGGALVFVPIAGSTRLRLAYEFEVVTADPPGRWMAWVDGSDGRLLARIDRVRHAVSGTAAGLVHPRLATDPQVTRPFANQFVTVGAATVTTNAAGFYSSAPGGAVTVTARLRGPFVDVVRQDAPRAVFSAPASDPAILDIAWNTFNSHDAERDAFHHVNLAHDYIRAIDPGLTTLDYMMPCTVNFPSTCNATWNGTGLTFFAAGGGCPNSASLADVVYHEYGHGVNDKLYELAGPGFMGNSALHEGLADAFAAFFEDDPRIGDGFTGPGTFLRTVDNAMRWPHDASGDEHVTGLIVAGALWDLREAIGLPATTSLSHFAKYGVPDDLDDGIAMSEFFVEMLVADDDDADLSNGTPNFAPIVAAFNAHGIGTGYFLNLSHAALGAQSAPGGTFPVTATITYAGPVGALDASSPTLHVALNQGVFNAIPMTPTGSPNQYTASIAAPAASIVRYYLTATDGYGGQASHPATVPNAVHTFIVGPASTLFTHDMETDAGWTTGAAGDNATSGLWVRDDPVGTTAGGAEVQPEDDHTADPGTICFVTGNADPGSSAGTNDVDGGRATLLTPAFDATAAGTFHPIVEYHRWYSNNAGANPGEDLWRADISNDGGASWTPVESTSQTDASWRRVVFRVEDVLTPTANMRMRFIAEDAGGGSLVEAAVDDFRLIGFPATLDVPGATSAGLALAAGPTPFTTRTTLRFTVPAAGATTLRVYDVGGRLVRVLLSGVVEAGEHALAWDGGADRGAQVATGVYFARLEHGGRTIVRRMLRVE